MEVVANNAKQLHHVAKPNSPLYTSVVNIYQRNRINILFEYVP